MRLKKLNEQQKLGELGKIMQRVNALQAQQQQFEDQYGLVLDRLRHQFHSHSQSLADIKDQYEYLAALRRRSQAAAQSLAAIQQELDQKRQAYQTARKEHRVLELLREAKLAEHRHAIEKEEAALFDEFNQRTTRRQPLDKAGGNDAIPHTL